MKKYFFILLTLFLANYSCTPGLQKFTESRFKMGTVVQITLFEKDKTAAEKEFEKAYAEIDRISSLFWEGNPESDIYKFNHRKSDTVEVTAEVTGLLSRAKLISKNTSGAFDMTIGTLRKLYNFKKGEEKIPDSSDVTEELKCIGFNKLEIDLRNNLLISQNQHFTLLTGAIVKGYAAQRALEKITATNRNGVLVNAGGDIFTSKRYDNQKWVVGVQDPRNRGKILGTVNILDGAVVTSGDYEQFSIIKGKRYHHIINPVTGFSSKQSHSSTVIAPNGELADALATGLFVLGADKGMKVLEKYPDVECMWVNSNGKIFKSDGFDNYFEE